MGNLDKEIKLFNQLEKLAQNVYDTHDALLSICDIFQADAACLWEINRQGRKNFLFLRAIHNRPDLDKIIKEKSSNRTWAYQLKYDIHSSDTISSQMFKTKKPIYGDLNEKPFVGRWLQQEHTIGLKNSGLNKIILIPVFDEKKTPLASISLYGKTDLLNHNLEFINSFSNYFSALWKSSHLKVIDLYSERRINRHEVHGEIISMQNSHKKLKNQLEIYGIGDHKQVQLPVDDLYDKLLRVHEILKKRSIFDRAFSNSHNFTYVNLRDAMTNTLQPIIQGQEKSKISLNKIFYPNHELEVRIDLNDFEHILRNIMENAVKYSVENTSIEVTINETEKLLQLSFHNLSFPLSEENWENIFLEGYRNNDNNFASIDGSGLGLYVVKSICDIYNVNVYFSQSKTSENSIYARCVLRLEIPKERFKRAAQ